MPYKKSLLSALFTLTLLSLSLVLAACGSDNSPSVKLSLEPTTKPQTTTPASTPTATEVLVGEATATRSSGPVAGNSTVAPTAKAAATRTPGATVTATPRPVFAPLTGFPGKLSLLSLDRFLYVAKFDGSKPQLILGDATAPAGSNRDGIVYDWPTWSKDGTKLAVMAYNIKGGNITSADVVVVGGDGKNPYKAQSNLQAPPIYMSWSPDGSLLSLLTSNSSTSSLELSLLDNSKGVTTSPAASRKVAEGSEIYTGWSPDSQQLLIHTNSSSNNSGTVALLAAKDSKAKIAPLKNTPGTFRVASFSHDGARLAYVAFNTQNSNDEILIQDKTGAALGTLDSAGKGLTLNWSPTNQKVAYSYRMPNSTQPVYKGISLAELDGVTAKNGKFSGSEIVTEPILAFFWSPDGKKIAYVGLNKDASFLTWNVYDLASKKSTVLTEWYPTRQIMQLFTYFDQYSQGHTVWSPDSKAVVFGGFTKEQVNAYAESDSEEDPGIEPTVFVVPTEGAQVGKMLPVAQGWMAFWAK